MDRPYGMLFISRRNSARSLMAEAVVNRLGGVVSVVAVSARTARRSSPLKWPIP